MGQHWMFLTFLGFVLAAVVGFGLWWLYSRLILLGSKYHYRYTKVPSRLSSSTRCARRMIPTLLRPVSFKEDEEACGTTETSYELDPHDD